MSNEEAGVKSYLGVDKANIWSGESIYSHYKILKLTPAQQSWVKEHCGLTGEQMFLFPMLMMMRPWAMPETHLSLSLTLHNPDPWPRGPYV